MAITNGYATLAQVKAALRITDNVDDTLLEMAIESASRAIDEYTNRNFYNAGTAVRYYAPNDSFNVTIDDLVSLTTLQTMNDNGDQVYDTTWTSTDYQLEPLNGVTDGITQPYTNIRAIGNYTYLTLGGEATVKVTGVWGWSAVPIQVTQAAVIQSSRIYKRLDSPLGIISGELGSMRVGSRIDPDVAQLIDGLRKIRFA
jgi:hypothetical protein